MTPIGYQGRRSTPTPGLATASTSRASARLPVLSPRGRPARHQPIRPSSELARRALRKERSGLRKPKTPGKLAIADFAFCTLVAVGVTLLLAWAVIKLVSHFA
jgi:hypothetical protein